MIFCSVVSNIDLDYGAVVAAIESVARAATQKPPKF
jgi:hypothetical protein